LYFLFILSNLYDIIKGKFNNTNNIINNSLIKKEENKKYEIKIENNTKISNDYKFKYFLEESMIIIN